MYMVCIVYIVSMLGTNLLHGKILYGIKEIVRALEKWRWGNENRNKTAQCKTIEHF